MNPIISYEVVRAVRKAYTQLDKHLTQEEVDQVLNALDFKSEHSAAKFLGVHVTSLRGWIHGRSKPSGRSKAVFNVILNSLNDKLGLNTGQEIWTPQESREEGKQIFAAVDDKPELFGVKIYDIENNGNKEA